jgi:hypothetical protein
MTAGDDQQATAKDKITKVHVCHFSSAEHLTGKRRTYEAVREAVLAAGRYSVFEATASKKSAALFTRLDNDPTLERFELGYPWIGVRRKKAEGEA